MRRGARAHAGNDVGERLVGVDMAADHVDEVDEPRVRETPGDLEAFAAREAAIPVLVADHSGADEKLASHPLADRGQDFDAESHAVVEAAAVVVVAFVGGGRPELVEEMSVAFELEPIEARGLHALGAVGVGLDDARDIPILHDFGEGAMRRLAHVRRRNHRQPIGLAPARSPAKMGDLDHHRRAMRVDVLGQLPQPRHDLVLVDEDVAERLRTVRRDHGRAADHGQPDPAFCLLGMVKPVTRLRHAVFGIGRLVRGRHQPIPHCEMLQPEGLQERIVRHSWLPSTDPRERARSVGRSAVSWRRDR